MTNELKEAAEKYAEKWGYQTATISVYIDACLSNAAKQYWYAQFKAEQKQVSAFPFPSEWIDEFKKAWMEDNDTGILSKKGIKKLWDSTERVCNMIYKYQRKAYESKSALQTNVGVSEWIDVKDKLPDYHKRVLLYKSYHDISEIGVRLRTDKHGEHYSCEYEHYVTHWQPLPAPPINNKNK